MVLASKQDGTEPWEASAGEEAGKTLPLQHRAQEHLPNKQPQRMKFYTFLLNYSDFLEQSETTSITEETVDISVHVARVIHLKFISSLSGGHFFLTGKIWFI